MKSLKNIKNAGSAVMVASALLSFFLPTVYAAEPARVIKITARRYEFTPSEITLKKGVLVVLQLSTADRSHGFYAPDLNLKADIRPGKTTELKLSPAKTGNFDFFCDVFCGSGHESMLGKIKVVD
ncbi:MAG: cupredoxin domain-containing protein [Cyanobacteria bacterium REEB67]|nr:cupredoxin domain-containing protein [Cyanobacteria bacterium REEB67]